mmetsp:Transcript_117973/g.341050  ORF Transcript_117973/g.341050 Transcript_117973/m.341050 type:complete len:221 (-) Transcript_117973:240-902(-)
MQRPESSGGRAQVGCIISRDDSRRLLCSLAVNCGRPVSSGIGFIADGIGVASGHACAFGACAVELTCADAAQTFVHSDYRDDAHVGVVAECSGGLYDAVLHVDPPEGGQRPAWLGCARRAGRPLLDRGGSPPRWRGRGMESPLCRRLARDAGRRPHRGDQWSRGCRLHAQGVLDEALAADDGVPRVQADHSTDLIALCIGDAGGPLDVGSRSDAGGDTAS